MKKNSGEFAALLVALISLTVARFLLGHAGTISSAEAYYWLLGERWEWASFEGPGGLPALVALLGSIFGPDPVVLRILSPFWVLLCSLGVWWWVRECVSKGAAFWAVVAWNCLPAVNAQAIEFGPGPLLVALWIWFGAIAWKASQAERDSALWWAGAGIVAAAGALVSYTMLLAPGALLAFWLLDLRLWPHLCRRKPASRRLPPRLNPLAVLSLLLPLLALAGPIFWNVETKWVAFAGQTWKSLTEFGGGATPEALAITLWEGGLAVPVLGFCGFVAAGIGMFVSRQVRWWFAFGLLPGVWVLLRLWRGEDAVLPLLLLLPVLIVCGADFLWNGGDPEREGRLHDWALRSRRILARAGAPAVLLAAVVAAASLLYFRPQSTEPDWSMLAERMRRVAVILQVAGDPPLFFIAGKADAAAGVGFHLLGEEGALGPDFPPVYVRESQNLASQFGLWPRYDEFVDSKGVIIDEFFKEQRGTNPFIGRGALYLGAESPENLPQVISNGFVRVIPIERIVDPRGRVFFLYQCEDYQTAPL